MARFVDHAVLHLQAGNGGHGCASVHREKFRPLGGPDGKPVYLDDLPGNKRFNALLAAVEGAMHRQ